MILRPRVSSFKQVGERADHQFCLYNLRSAWHPDGEKPAATVSRCVRRIQKWAASARARMSPPLPTAWWSASWISTTATPDSWAWPTDYGFVAVVGGAHPAKSGRCGL